MKQIIDLEGITTVYEGECNPTIHDVDLKVENGEFICLVGPNGAGKTYNKYKGRAWAFGMRLKILRVKE